MHEYQIIGRKLPSASEPAPQLYKMRIFASNEIVAKSRFWYFLSKLKKVKRAAGEVVSFSEVSEKKPLKIKNFGIWLRYDSRSGTHNMYKEFRELSRADAVKACCKERVDEKFQFFLLNYHLRHGHGCSSSCPLPLHPNYQGGRVED